MKNNKKLIAVLIFIMLFISVFIFNNPINTSNVLLTDVEEVYRNILNDAYLVEVGKEDYSYTCFNEKNATNIIDILKKLEVSEDKTSINDVSQMDKTYYISIRSKNGEYIRIFFDKNMSTLWMDYADTLDPMNLSNHFFNITDIYRLENKETMDLIFTPLNPYYDENLYDKNFIDGRILEIKEDSIVLKEERLDSNIYEINNWKNLLGKTYLLSSEFDVNKFKEGDKVRIECDNKQLLQENTILYINDVKNIYYLNELLYLKNPDNKNTQYFSEEDISIAMELLLENIGSYERQNTSIIYIYCNDDEAMDAYLTWDKLYGGEDVTFDVENKIYVFFKVLTSRAMYGEEADKYDFGKYGYGGYSNFERCQIEERKKL